MRSESLRRPLLQLAECSRLLSSMTLARTVVRQTWNIRDGYHVTDEVVVEGAPELLPASVTAAPADDVSSNELASTR
jgi:hypothetical protein